MGMSPQSGVPQNNRVGDFDAFSLPMVMKHTGASLEATLDVLAEHSGLLGLSGGLSGDIRDLEQAAKAGNPDAQLALDVYVWEIRRQLGGMLVALGGCDAIVFTGGIGENGASIRAAVCDGLGELGIVLDDTTNASTRSSETRIDAAESRAQVWVIPTNEEVIVARQTVAALSAS